MFTNDDFDTFKHFHISENPEEEKDLIKHFNHVAKKNPPHLLTICLLYTSPSPRD